LLLIYMSEKTVLLPTFHLQYILLINFNLFEMKSKNANNGGLLDKVCKKVLSAGVFLKYSW
jgi:hypothetical protein